MTGFGRARGPVGREWTGEVLARAVNSRFLDLVIKTKDTEAALEPVLRRVFGRRVSRGKIEVALRLRRTAPLPQQITVDEELLESLLARLARLSERFPIQGALTPRDVLSIPQVVTVEPPGDDGFSAEEVAAVETLAEEAAAALVAMRESEGRAIAEDLGRRIGRLRQTSAALGTRRDEIVRNLAAALRDRIRALFPDVALDPGRLEQEAALAADRSDVAEELQRLAGHLDQFGALIEKPSAAIGKTLDFLAQELLRELNTLASKSRDLQSTREILDMKAETEKIREQVQNVE
jgi:uncharacterized protein (TIGR00255 family)